MKTMNNNTKRVLKRVNCASALLSLLGLLVLALLQGCAPKEDDIIIPSITPSIQELKANASGGTFTISIESNVKWNIIGEATDWSLASKVDDHTLSIVINESTKDQDRKTSVLLAAENYEVKIPIIQRERAEISIEEQEISLTSKASEKLIKVESNYAEWSVKSSESWLKATKDQDAFVKLEAEENKSTENAREALVTLSVDGKEKSIIVKQDYTTVITLSKNTISFPWQGGEERIEIQSNKEVNIDSTLMPSMFKITIEDKSPILKRLNITMGRYDYERPLDINLNVTANDTVIPISIVVEASMFNKNQMEALKALYIATDGDNWTRNDNWLSDKPITEWYGIVGIDFTQNPEKDPELSVTMLNLSNNNLVGEIPKEIGMLDDLMMLKLSGNHLRGSVPEELSSISKLLELDLSNNELSGTLPSFLFNKLLTTRTLKLNNNDFEGYIDFDKLISPEVKLSKVEVQMNKLRGPKPKQIKGKRIKIVVDPQKEGYGFE